jgi:prevent-host-death family protein
MTTVTIHEAKTHMSRLLVRVEAGEEIVIARRNTEIAKIVPMHPKKKPDRVPGWLAHQSPDGREIIGPAFWEPLNDEEMGIADRDDDPLSPNYRR